MLYILERTRILLRTRIIGIAIMMAISLLIDIGCILIINRKFKKAKLRESKNFRKDIKTAFSNGFIASSIFSIVVACIIYGFLEKLLEILNLSEGIINYCIFATKIWFISSPFIGLQFAIFKYFISIDYWEKNISILIIKFLTYLSICVLYYHSRKFNCFIYAKPVCDFIFLIYYSKICFDITLNKC